MFSKALFSRAASAASCATPKAWRGCFAMPLRAKIVARQPESRSRVRWQHMSSQAASEEDVLFNSHYGLRTIELNRPGKLNSLNGSMIEKITPRLLEWQKSDMANVVVMKGAGDKAFCAGGDVAALAKNNVKGPEGQAKSNNYFAHEYALDHLIATYQTPYVAFMDGITMGGGVGLSVHAPLRIATERSVFAMPETDIGFFPDVGASFFLPRMDGAVGTYLALTSDRLKGVDVFYTGIATHYMHSTSLPMLESRLAELRFMDDDPLDLRLAHISATIEEYATGLPHDKPMYISGDLRKAIDRCFSKDSIPRIISALETEEQGPDEPIKKWATRTLETLRQRSPTAVHVSLLQMRMAEGWSIRKVFEREHLLAAKFMASPDFTEGVTAKLINKPATQPKWKPATLDEIKDSDVRAFLRQPEPEATPEPIKFLTDLDFYQYPHRELGLPREKDVHDLLKDSIPRSQHDIIKHFVDKTKAKLGVKEVVSEIVYRKTQKGSNKEATWIY
ncbi:hypothetical protein RB601_006596 [Gaeumannomyces tritici]